MGILSWSKYIPCTFVGYRKVGGRCWDESGCVPWLLSFQHRYFQVEHFLDTRNLGPLSLVIGMLMLSL